MASMIIILLICVLELRVLYYLPRCLIAWLLPLSLLLVTLALSRSSQATTSSSLPAPHPPDLPSFLSDLALHTVLQLLLSHNSLLPLSTSISNLLILSAPSSFNPQASRQITFCFPSLSLVPNNPRRPTELIIVPCSSPGSASPLLPTRRPQGNVELPVDLPSLSHLGTGSASSPLFPPPVCRPSFSNPSVSR
ncbi:uncharacterized protein BDV17DRAFT_86225 [Aspergillus undulatus]|uniref:uncharacterized protein n=1 Tax=Aspergillus undulatus TaxID=1810928 RepID=UPI003CCE19DD